MLEAKRRLAPILRADTAAALGARLAVVVVAAFLASEQMARPQQAARVDQAAVGPVATRRPLGPTQRTNMVAVVAVAREQLVQSGHQQVMVLAAAAGAARLAALAVHALMELAGQRQTPGQRYSRTSVDQVAEAGVLAQVVPVELQAEEAVVELRAVLAARVRCS